MQGQGLRTCIHHNVTINCPTERYELFKWD